MSFYNKIYKSFSNYLFDMLANSINVPVISISLFLKTEFMPDIKMKKHNILGKEKNLPDLLIDMKDIYTLRYMYILYLYFS